MREVYIELFLLDNGLMGLLILRVAAPLAKRALNPWMTALACAGSAAVAALAMRNSFFLSLPVKALLLALMSAAFLPKTPKSALRCGLCVLLSTCVMGGLAYMVAGAFSEGVLYADTSVRALLAAFCLSTFLPRPIKNLLAKIRLPERDLKVELRSKEHSMTLRARVDTGCTLKEAITGLPVIVVDKRARRLFPQEPGLAVQYTTVNGPGEMPAAVAGVRAAGGEEPYKSCCIALSPAMLAECEALVNPEIFTV